MQRKRERSEEESRERGTCTTTLAQTELNCLIEKQCFTKKLLASPLFLGQQRDEAGVNEKKKREERCGVVLMLFNLEVV